MLQLLYVLHKTVNLNLIADYLDLTGRLEEQCHWFDHKYQCRLRESYRSICLKFFLMLYSCTLVLCLVPRKLID